MALDPVLAPVATLAFPIVAGPQPDKRSGKPKWSCVLLIPKTANIDHLRAQAKLARDGQWPNEATRPKGLKSGIKDGDVPNTNGEIRPEFVGHWVINCVTYYAPKLADLQAKPVPNVAAKDMFYAGCKVIGFINAYAYDNENKGVAFGLSALQFAGDGTRLSGGNVNVSSVFSPVPGSKAAAANGDSEKDFLDN